MTDLPWSEPETPANPAATPRKCRHPRAYRQVIGADMESETFGCGLCGKAIRVADSLRGRRSRNRGNAIERQVVTSLGMKRTGQYGGPDDGRGALFAAQVKSGGAYPERLHRWLKAVPVDAGQTAILIVTDAPGPGHRRRGLVVLDLDDWRDLHGE